MRAIGYSTGSLAYSDFLLALDIMGGRDLSVVELSALRENELMPLVKAIPKLDLRNYDHVALHAPSQLNTFTEVEIVNHLQIAIERSLPIILHPDIIQDFGCWQQFGELLFIENMDKHKSAGRTASELSKIFDLLPKASLCMDVGHARQVDPTMGHAVEILHSFGDRLRQLHVSEVNSSSKHERLNQGTIRSFERITHLIPQNVPIILESPISAEEVDSEVQLVRKTFSPQPALAI